MRRLKKILFTGLCTCLILSASCGRNENEWKLSLKVAREMQNDGWVYSFEYQYMKDGTVSDSHVPYFFSGYNLRYRYPADQSASGTQVIQTLGSKSPDMEHDIIAINEYLMQSNKKSPDELLADPLGGIELLELDQDLYLRLMKQALSSPPQNEGKYINIPSGVMLNEQFFLDGYEFQIGLIGGMGSVDVIYIDVLIEDPSMPRGYQQLSDLVENGKASEVQKEAFRALNDISAGIVKENDLLFGADTYRFKTYDNIEFSRLYAFLENNEADYFPR